MIVVSARVKVRPDRRAEAVEAARVMAEATVQEPGCIFYRFYSDLQDPTAFLVFEEWESRAALDAHFQTEHMVRFRSALPDLVAGDLSVKVYEVSSASEL